MSGLPKQISGLKLSSMVPPNKVLEVNESMKIREAIDVLASHGISSCPVRRAGDTSTMHIDNFSGMIDVLDIVAFLLETQPANKSLEIGFEQVLDAVVSFGEHTVGDVIKQYQTLRHQSIDDDHTVGEALHLMGEHKYHRLLVLDNAQHIINVVTQMSMLRFITDKLDNDPEYITAAEAFFNTPLLQAQGKLDGQHVNLLTGNQVATIMSNQRVIEVFKIIHRKRISGVAIVDKQGGLIGNISARDIRTLVAHVENFDNLYCTAEEFLCKVQEDRAKRVAKLKADSTELTLKQMLTDRVYENVYSLTSSHVHLPQMVSITPYDTVGYLLLLLSRYRIHRVYFTSGKIIPGGDFVHVPHGVVTLSDIIKFLACGV